jgi:1-acyl-sn-glycerol-3-phosphate acyltransferase
MMLLQARPPARGPPSRRTLSSRRELLRRRLAGPPLPRWPEAPAGCLLASALAQLRAGADAAAQSPDLSGARPATEQSAAQQRAGALDLRSLWPAEHAPLSWQLLLWSPLGCVVAPCRALLWLALAALDAPAITDADAPLRFIVHRLLGVESRWKHWERVPRDGFVVLVSNHCSVGDFLCLYTQPRGRVLHLVHPGVPERVFPRRHRVIYAHATPHALKRIRRERQSAVRQAEAVHFFPEGILSSGAAVLPFSRSFATLGCPVVPVALRSEHALGIRTHTLESSFAANLWWLCFAPWARLEATVLPPMERGLGEDTAAFAERVRAVVALELGVGLCQLGAEDKAAYRQQVRAERAAGLSKSSM